MDQTPNNNQPNQPTPTTGSAPTPPPAQTPPVTTASVPPAAPQPTEPSQSTPLPTPSQTPPVNQTPIPSTPPTMQPQPTKKSAMPLIIGGVVVLLLAIGVASFVLFSKNKAQTSQVTTARTTSVASPAPSQNTLKQIQAVDSNASDSSDLQGIQNSIDQL